MKFDVTSELEVISRRDEQSFARGLVDLALERRLLAAMLCDDGIGGYMDPEHRENALALCDDVELDDFSDFRLRAAFTAIRALQARDEFIPNHERTSAVADEIERTDRARGSHVGARVDLVFLTDLVLDEKQLGAASIEHAKARLRELATFRRLL